MTFRHPGRSWERCTDCRRRYTTKSHPCLCSQPLVLITIVSQLDGWHRLPNDFPFLPRTSHSPHIQDDLNAKFRPDASAESPPWLPTAVRILRSDPGWPSRFTSAHSPSLDAALARPSLHVSHRPPPLHAGASAPSPSPTFQNVFP